MTNESSIRRHIPVAIFTLLNLLRTVTIVTLCIAFASSLYTLAHNLALRAEDRSAGTGNEVAYFEETDIPLQAGGVVGFALAHVFSAIFFLAAAVSEMPLPHPVYTPVQQFWDLAFRPFSEDSGGAVLGIAMVWLGSYELARDTSRFERASSWLLFVLGIVNAVIGVSLGTQHSYQRSLAALPSRTTPSLATAASPSIYSNNLPPPVTSHRPKISRTWSLPIANFFRRRDQEDDGEMNHGRREFVEVGSPHPAAPWTGDEMSRLGPMTQVRRAT